VVEHPAWLPAPLWGELVVVGCIGRHIRCFVSSSCTKFTPTKPRLSNKQQHSASLHRLLTNSVPSATELGEPQAAGQGRAADPFEPWSDVQSPSGVVQGGKGKESPFTTPARRVAEPGPRDGGAGPDQRVDVLTGLHPQPGRLGYRLALEAREDRRGGVRPDPGLVGEVAQRPASTLQVAAWEGSRDCPRLRGSRP
jgi:hypothetical protein